MDLSREKTEIKYCKRKSNMKSIKGHTYKFKSS